MDPIAFEHHLTSPQGHRRRPPGAFTATAGGAVCCDQIELSLSVEGDRVSDAGFDASGCGATTAAGSAAVTLARNASVIDAARIGPKHLAVELGGLSPGKFHAAELAADALARALGAAARGGAGLTSAPRTLVAMSGGVDSAVAALLCARETETVAVTLELLGGCRERRRTQLLLGLRGRPGAGAGPHDEPAALHDRSAGRVPSRGG